MRKCDHCNHDVEDHDDIVHRYCADELESSARDTGFDRGKEEGNIEGHEEARSELAESVQAKEVKELALALRLGDIPRAEIALDLIAADIEGWADMVASGRYNTHTRKAA